MFLLPVLLVRRLSVHEFGIYKQVFLVVASAVTLLPLGFGMSAYYFMPRHEDKGRVVLNILLFYAAIGGVTCAVLVLRPDLLGALFGDPALTDYAPLVGLIVLLWIPASVLETLAIANGEARFAATTIVLIQLTKAIALWMAALIAGTVHALVVAAVIHGVVQAAALAAYVSRRFRGFWRGFDPALMRAQLAYALPLGAAGLLYWAQVDFHKYLVANRFDAATFATYVVGCFDVPLLFLLHESVGSVLIPRMNELHKDGRRREMVEVAASGVRKLAAIYLPMYVLLLVIGRELIVVLFTNQYLAAWPIFAIYMTLVPFAILTVTSDAVIRAHAEHRYFLVRLRVVSTVLMVSGVWFGLGAYGLVGAISVVVAVNLVERLLTTIKAARLLEVTWADARLVSDVARIAGATLFAGVVAYAVRLALAGSAPAAVLVASSAAMGTCYLAAIFLLRVPSDDELASFIALFRRSAPRSIVPVANHAVAIPLPPATAAPSHREE